MPNPYFTENFQGQEGQTARADQVRNELIATESGFDGVNADVNRTVKGAVGETLAALPNAATRALKFLRFDAAGNPIAVQSGFTWRGDWAQSTIYAVGDVVRQGVYGSLFITTTAHTSSTSFNAANFSVLIDLTGLNVIRNEIKTASFTAIVGGDYAVDSSGGNVVITLPAAPTILDAPINITHIGGTLGAGQTITVARNGKLIMGLAEDLTIDAPNTSVSFMFIDDARGWRLRVLA